MIRSTCSKCGAKHDGPRPLGCPGRRICRNGYGFGCTGIPCKCGANDGHAWLHHRLEGEHPCGASQDFGGEPV